MSRRSQIDGPLAEALARGESLTKAAEIVGCSLSTAKRRWNEPDFRRRVIAVQEDGRRQRQGIMYASWHLGVQLVPTALRALQDTLQDPQASHLDKSRAARLLLRVYGPKEEPGPPPILSVEDEQASAAMAEQVRRLLTRANVVDLDTRRPAPAYQPAPGPLGGYPTVPTAPRPPVDEDLDDDLDDPVAVGDSGVRVGQELVAGGPAAAPGPPEHAPVAPEPPEEDLEVVRARAMLWLQRHPHRPPAGPDLVAWLEARKVVGLDPTPTDRPRPRRRRRTL